MRTLHETCAVLYAFSMKSFQENILPLIHTDMMAPHPLSNLSLHETNHARSIILANEDANAIVHFRSIFTQEPVKNELIRFLQLERSGSKELDEARPARLAQCHYDVVAEDKKNGSYESIVDLASGKITKRELIHENHLAMLTMYGLYLMTKTCR